jgi:hypothetical protein
MDLQAKKAQLQARQQELANTAAQHENTIRQSQAAIEQIKAEWNQNIGRIAQIDDQIHEQPEVTTPDGQRLAPGPRPIRDVTPRPPLG